MTLHEAALKLIESEQAESGMLEIDEDTMVELVQCIKAHLANLEEGIDL